MTKQKTRQQRRAEERERGKRLQSQRPAGSRAPIVLAGAGILAVIIVIAALVIVKGTQGGSTPQAGSRGAAPAAVVHAVTTVPASTFNTVGYQHGVTAPAKIAGTPIRQGGKPLVVYVGAEYCPYCAAERWAVVAALSRFGTFHNLGQTHSSSIDVYPNTATFSFHGATYTSRYLALDTVELATNQPQGQSYKRLETPTALEDRLVNKYDPGGTIPLIYLGRYAITSASYNPQILSGMSLSQIATALRNPISTQSQAIVGTANLITAALCTQTSGAPAAVCTSPGVTAAAKHLPT